jgi:hypothetical protein
MVDPHSPRRQIGKMAGSYFHRVNANHAAAEAPPK